eukprot:jgi/Mesvir1/9863/Mv22401-RA.1
MADSGLVNQLGNLVIGGNAGNSALVHQLRSLGIGENEARMAAEMGARTADDAMEMLASIDEDGKIRTGLGPCVWREYWSFEYKRMYYYQDRRGDGISTTWDPPLRFLLQECMVDSEMYAIGLVDAKRIVLSVSAFVEDNCHKDRPVLIAAFSLLSRLFDNVAREPGNAKFRTIRLPNEAFATKVMCLQGVLPLMSAGGFRLEGGERLVVDASFDTVAPPLLGRIRCMASRLQVVSTNLQREENPREKEMQARFYGGGHTCSDCGRKINDGTERLWSRRFDAPKGEYRYHCTTCEGFNLCETCWDVRQAGGGTHPKDHVFEYIQPREQRHSIYHVESSNSPWGSFTGASAARARERLKDRTGL